MADQEGPPPKHPARNAPDQELEEAEGERQQKDGDRQAGEGVENVRERIRQTQPRPVR